MSDYPGTDAYYASMPEHLRLRTIARHVDDIRHDLRLHADGQRDLVDATGNPVAYGMVAGLEHALRSLTLLDAVLAPTRALLAEEDAQLAADSAETA